MNRIGQWMFARSLRTLPRWFREKHADDMQLLFQRNVDRRFATAFALWDVLRLAVSLRWPGGQAMEDSGKARIGFDLGRDIGFAFRMLARAPGFTALVLVTIGLGVGANTAIFSVVHTVVWKPLPFSDPDRIMIVWPEISFSKASYQMFESAATAFQSLAAYSQDATRMQTPDGAEMLPGPSVTARFFDVLGLEAVQGRTFRMGEDELGNARVAVVREGYWRRRLGGGSDVVGSAQQLDERSYTVVGVVPDAIRLIQHDAESAVPFVMHESQPDFNANYLRVIGRLKPGVSPAQAQAEVRTIASRWRAEFGLSEDFGTTATVQPIHEWLIGSVRPQMLLLFAAVGLILILTAANLAHLMLARTLARSQEVSVRVALGARPSRIARQFIAEASVLGVIGGVVGFGLGAAGVRGLVGFLPAETPRLEEVRVDGLILGFSFAVALSTAWIVSVFPALRSLQVDVRGALVAGGRALTATGRRQRFRGALVVGEVALAMVLLAGAGVLVKSFRNLVSVDPGLEPQGLLAFYVSPSDRSYPTAERTEAYYSELIDRLEAVPGVESAAAIHNLPVGGGGWVSRVRWEGLNDEPGDALPPMWWRAVTDGYFGTAGIRLLRGRFFDARDRPSAPPTVVLNETAAARFWPGEDPLGRWVQFARDPVQRTVVGVVADVRILGLERESPPTAYFAYRQSVSDLTGVGVRQMSVMVRTSGEPDRFVGPVRAAVHEVDPTVPIDRMRPMNTVIWESVAGPRVLATLIALFAATALALGAVGIYGVMAHLVGERTREMGIRVALGAAGGRVARNVLLEAMAHVAVGIAIGVGAAIGLSRFLESQLFDVRPTDPWVLAAVALGLTAVAAFAAFVPARNASRVDPMSVLRNE